MTLYVAQFLPAVGSPPINVAMGAYLRAGQFPVRIIKATAIAVAGNDAGFGAVYSRYDGVTAMAGGTVRDPFPPREQAGPVSSVVRYRPATWNGSTTTLSQGSAVTLTGGGSEIRIIQGGNEWVPDDPAILMPGSVFAITPWAGSTSFSNYHLRSFAIWFDEERISRSA